MTRTLYSRGLLFLALLLLTAGISARRPNNNYSGGGSSGNGSGSSSNHGGSGGIQGGNTGNHGVNTGNGSGNTGNHGGNIGSGGGNTGNQGGNTGSQGGNSGSQGGNSGNGGGGHSGIPDKVQHTYPPSNGWSGTSYRPPQNIKHGTQNYPVLQSSPPSYVYQIRDSGSRYSFLVTGLALWNLGRDPSNKYKMLSYEVCMFRMIANGKVEDRRISCLILSSFIQEWGNQGYASGVVVEDSNTANNSVMDVMTDRGQPILATPGMRCYIIRRVRNNRGGYRTTTQNVDCELLQLYTANAWDK